MCYAIFCLTINVDMNISAHSAKACSCEVPNLEMHRVFEPQDTALTPVRAPRIDALLKMTITVACQTWFAHQTGDGAVQVSGFTVLSVYPKLLITRGLQELYTFTDQGVWCTHTQPNDTARDDAETPRVSAAQPEPHSENDIALDAVLCHPHFVKAAQDAGVHGHRGMQRVLDSAMTPHQIELHTRCTECLLRDMDIDTPEQLGMHLLRRLNVEYVA